MGAGFEMKSIDDVASLPPPHSTSNGIDRATVWDAGLFERAAADARLAPSIPRRSFLPGFSAPAQTAHASQTLSVSPSAPLRILGKLH